LVKGVMVGSKYQIFFRGFFDESGFFGKQKGKEFRWGGLGSN